MSREGPGNFGCSAAAAGGHFSKRGTMLPDCNVPGRMHCGVLPALRHRWSAWDFCGNDCRRSPFLFLMMFYGQISKIAILPVTEGWLLRADFKNRLFARNRGLAFTGKSQKSPFCP